MSRPHPPNNRRCVNPQMLRTYEAKGLVEPHRTEGGTRHYSGSDLERIGHITTLLDEGLNLAGIAHVLALQAETHRLRAEIQRLRNFHRPDRTRQRKDTDPPGGSR